MFTIKPHSTIELMTEVNGIPVKATVNVYVEEDFDSDPLDLDFESEIDKKEYGQRFERGELFNAGITVEATAYGETGIDSLWGNHMACNNMFNPEPFENDLQSILKYHDMIENAIDNLKKQLVERANALKQFAGGAK